MEALGLLVLLVLWGVLGLAPWCGALIIGRGRGALVALPLAFLAGVGGGALVPALAAKDMLGFGVSLLAAVTAGGAASLASIGWALWARRTAD